MKKIVFIILVIVDILLFLSLFISSFILIFSQQLSIDIVRIILISIICFIIDTAIVIFI